MSAPLHGPNDESAVDRGSGEDQDRWLADLEAAELAEDFPPGGSLILAESPEHAQSIALDMKARGHRVIARGAYVRTTAVMRSGR